MKKIEDINELRSIQMNLLSYVDALCAKNNINYSLAGGTLIGAIRHHGYIPWDDDIDILLARPEYEKLIELLKKENENYKLLNCYVQKDCFLPFSKLVDNKTVLKESYDRNFKNYGVYIDIFPIDGLPNNEKQRKSYWNKMRILKRINTMVYSKNSKGENFSKQIFRRFMFFVLGFISHNYIAKKLNEYAKENDYETSEFVACSIFGYGEREQMFKSCLDHFIKVDFENKKFSAISDYHIYLSNLYGDYMQLPPLDKQIAKHDFEAYWKD